MLRVLLVDDEVLVLRYLEKSICWAELNMCVVGTAVDGIKALSFILNNEVDIVLTDIKMPGMDGIDLIKKALAVKPDIYFIVLSSYNDFPLVKEAFVSGARDYALKVDIDSEEFLNVIKAAEEKIQSKGRQPLTFSIDKAMECCNESINISDDDYLFVLAIHVPDRIDEDFVLHELEKNKAGYKGVFLNSNREIIFVSSVSRKGKGFIDSREECAGVFKKKLTECLYVHFLIGVSSIGRYEDLEKLYNEACKAYMEEEFYDMANCFLKYDEIQSSITSCMFSELSRQLKLHLENMEFNVVNSFFEKALNDFKIRVLDSKSVISYTKDIFQYYINYLMDAGLISIETNYRQDIDEGLNGICSFKQLQIWYFEQINNVNRIISEKRNTNLVDLIKIYVDKNFEKDPTLGDVAKHFNISEVYLSLIFSKKIGMRFKEYINNLKIEKAKLLLKTTDDRISEISEQVGYSSIEHFLRVFRKSVGTSPLDYRNMSYAKS